MINIYKASAGSGKTFTLAREYIKLLLGRKNDDGSYSLNVGAHNAHRSILAITFTNKATEEMKSRIIHELALIAGLEKNQKKESLYSGYLCKSLSCTESQLKKEAARALHELLYDFSFFSISTIDSFFQTILRAFAREAEISGNYDLELDDKAIIAMSIDKLLQDLNHGEESRKKAFLIKWLTDYMTALIEDGKTFNIFNRSSKIHGELISFVKDITDDDYRENETGLLNYFSNETLFSEFKTRIFDTIRKHKEAVKMVSQNALDAIVSHGADALVYSNIINTLKKWAQSGFDKKPLGITVKKAIEDIDAAYKKAALNSPVREHLDRIISDALHQIDNCSSLIRTLRIISQNLYQLGLISSIATYLYRYRQENSTILLSDTNTLISKIIGVDNPDTASDEAPFLYERVGVRYHHFLIDEFQDTSHSQWANIRPLVRESLAYGHDNLVIGDEKQCIYRFRNSDPSLLHNLHLEPMAHGRVTISGDKLTENTNWRSSADVIEFNNKFFSALVRNLGFEDIYSNVAQQISPPHQNHRGFIRVTQYSGSSKGEWIEEALDLTAKELRRQLESGYLPGEIAILVRSRSEGQAVIQHLEEVRHNDPTYPKFRIVSDASLVIGNSPAVILIISRLKLLASTDFAANPRKKSQREVAELINRFETIRSTCASPSQALLAAIDGSVNIEKSDINSNPNIASSVDLITLIETIINDFVPEENRRSDYQFLTAFQELATDFVARGHGDIRSFLQWWEETGSNISVQGASDSTAINILTIHKSKGLEFPCVILPFAHLGSGNHSELSWFKLDSLDGFDKEIIPPMLPLQISKDMLDTPFEEKYLEVSRQNLLDDLNLLYVAFTRAIDELIIGFPSSSARSSGLAEEITDGLASAFSFNDGTIMFGKPTTRKDEKKKEGSVIRPSEHIDPDKYHISNHQDIWANTRLEEKFYNIEEARDRGTMLHDLMSSVYNCSDIDDAVNTLRYSRKAKDLTQHDLSELHSIILKRVNDPRVRRWFEGYRKVLIERPIAVSSNHTVRPDRVVWTEDGHIDVVDFKSGTQPPGRYFKQMREYVDLLCRAGFDNVRGFLYYLDSGDIVQI